MFKAGYSHPEYLTENMEVIIPYRHEGKLYGLICRVIVACGDSGRVVNERYKVDKWVDRYEMAVPKTKST